MFGKIVLAIGLSFCLGTAAFAAGNGGGNAPSQPSEYRKAVKAIKKEDYARAVELLQKVVDENPKNANAWNYMGYSLRNLKKYDEALAAYEKALQIKPKHKGALEYLGELYLQTDQLEKAKVTPEKVGRCLLSLVQRVSRAEETDKKLRGELEKPI